MILHDSATSHVILAYVRNLKLCGIDLNLFLDDSTKLSLVNVLKAFNRYLSVVFLVLHAILA